MSEVSTRRTADRCATAAILVVAAWGSGCAEGADVVDRRAVTDTVDGVVHVTHTLGTSGTWRRPDCGGSRRGSRDGGWGRALVIEADLSDAGAPQRLFDEVERAVGPVRILVNNAAHRESPDTILGITAGGLERHFAVNARAPTLLIHEFAFRHKRGGRSEGRIINISTDAARAFATQIGYGASKAALEALTRSTAIGLGSLGITVNAVAPGPVQTGWITRELEQQVLPWIPLGRIGTPADIADTVVFLASRQAGWITGQVIQVAGGHAL